MFIILSQVWGLEKNARKTVMWVTDVKECLRHPWSLIPNHILRGIWRHMFQPFSPQSSWWITFFQQASLLPTWYPPLVERSKICLMNSALFIRSLCASPGSLLTSLPPFIVQLLCLQHRVALGPFTHFPSWVKTCVTFSELDCLFPISHFVFSRKKETKRRLYVNMCLIYYYYKIISSRKKG